VPIYYEGRLAKVELKPEEPPKIDPNFEEATEGEELDHKEKLKTNWAALEAVAGAEKRIGPVAEDFLKHWDARLEASTLPPQKPHRRPFSPFLIFRPSSIVPLPDFGPHFRPVQNRLKLLPTNPFRLALGLHFGLPSVPRGQCHEAAGQKTRQ